MDWSKAKNVLIAAFLLLNLLLGYQLWSDIREQLNINQNSAELPADKLLIMQQKRISLSANLPIHAPPMRDLTYLLHSGSRSSTEPIKLDKQIDTNVIFSEGALAKALGDTIPDLKEYQYDLISSTDGAFVLYRKVDGHPMFDIKLELYYRDQKIWGYLQDRIELLGMGEPKPVLSAAKVVTSLIETYLPNHSVITDIQLGYHGQIFDSEQQVMAPAWRVLLEDGSVYYVNAISGEAATNEQPEQTQLPM